MRLSARSCTWVRAFPSISADSGNKGIESSPVEKNFRELVDDKLDMS